MQASITRWGFADSPILDERTQRLVAGHGRIEDLQWRYESGSKPPDGVRVDDDGMWLVPVQRGWRSETDADAEGFLVGHNHVGERGGWNERELADTLSDLNSEDPSILFATAFSETDLDGFIAKFADTEQRVADAPTLPDTSDDDDDDEGWGDGAGDRDPEHRQWHTIVIREVDGTTRAAWLAHCDTFNGDESAAFDALLGTGAAVDAGEGDRTRAGLLRVGAGVYVERDAPAERPDGEPTPQGDTDATAAPHLRAVADPFTP